MQTARPGRLPIVIDKDLAIPRGSWVRVLQVRVAFLRLVLSCQSTQA